MTKVLGYRKTIDAAALAITVGLALAGLHSVYSGWWFLAVGAVGLAAGLVIAALARRFRLPAMTAASIAVVATVLVGGPLLMPETVLWYAVPTSRTVQAVADGALHGWRDALTTLPPFSGGHLLTPVFLSGIAAGCAGHLLAGRTAAIAPIPAPLAVLLTAILLGADHPALLALTTAGFIPAALAWVALRQRRVQTIVVPGAERSDRIRGAVVMLAVAAIAGSAVLALPLLDGGRFVLREHVEPPFDPQAYASPLSAYRRYEVAQKDVVLFTVQGLPAGSRLRLSVMDAYDGVLWGVAGGASRTSSSGVFQRVGDRIPTTGPDPAADVTITVGQLGGVWMPTTGEVRSVSFGGARARELASSFRFNRTTEVAVATAGLRSGDSYRMSVVTASMPPAEQLQGMRFGGAVLPELAGSPDIVAASAVKLASSAESGVPQMESLARALRAGAFSDGTAEAGVVSLPGHGAKRMAEFLGAEQFVGDGEQYASALALLARSLGIPARVVLGVVPGSAFSGKVTGSMVTAWVEVLVAGAGWVPFDATPPVTNRPKPPKPENNPVGTAVVIEPPLVLLQPPAQVPPPVVTTGKPLCGNHPCRPRWHVPWWVKWILAPLTALLGLLGLVVLAKWRRGRARRRGSPLDRTVAAWQELVDRLRDLGWPVPATGSRPQRAAGSARLRELALAVDCLIFAPEPPDSRTVSGLWGDVDTFLRTERRLRARWRRTLAAVDPRSLRPAWWRAR